MRQLGIVAIIVFGAIQLIHSTHDPPKTNEQQSFTADPSVPADVKNVIQRACYDCHSNRTSWPWYSHVAPVSWILNHHVRAGRRKLNFSDWIVANQAPAQNSQLKKIEAPQICDSVQHGSMPLFSYRIMHENARLSSSDVQAICKWAQNARRAPAPGFRPPRS